MNFLLISIRMGEEVTNRVYKRRESIKNIEGSDKERHDRLQSEIMVYHHHHHHLSLISHQFWGGLYIWIWHWFDGSTVYLTPKMLLLMIGLNGKVELQRPHVDGTMTFDVDDDMWFVGWNNWCTDYNRSSSIFQKLHELLLFAFS